MPLPPALKAVCDAADGGGNCCFCCCVLADDLTRLIVSMSLRSWLAISIDIPQKSGTKWAQSV